MCSGDFRRRHLEVSIISSLPLQPAPYHGMRMFKYSDLEAFSLPQYTPSGDDSYLSKDADVCLVRYMYCDARIWIFKERL
jgi:hypothetical protein